MEWSISGEQAHGEAPEAPQLATRTGIDECRPVWSAHQRLRTKRLHAGDGSLAMDVDSRLPSIE
jgi:hypothetical protein